MRGQTQRSDLDGLVIEEAGPFPRFEVDAVDPLGAELDEERFQIGTEQHSARVFSFALFDPLKAKHVLCRNGCRQIEDRDRFVQPGDGEVSVIGAESQVEVPVVAVLGQGLQGAGSHLADEDVALQRTDVELRAVAGEADRGIDDPFLLGRLETLDDLPFAIPQDHLLEAIAEVQQMLAVGSECDPIDFADVERGEEGSGVQIPHASGALASGGEDHFALGTDRDERSFFLSEGKGVVWLVGFRELRSDWPGWLWILPHQRMVGKSPMPDSSAIVRREEGCAVWGEDEVLDVGLVRDESEHGRKLSVL